MESTDTATSPEATTAAFEATVDRPILLTTKAIEVVKQTMEQESLGGYGLRVAVVGGGCSGYSYALDFAEESDPEDMSLDFDGLTVYLDPNSARILQGTTIDYMVTLTKSGFVFQNPKATRTCGCGSSFSA